MKIKELPKELRPREKALHYGIESLSDEELLTILIGSGVRGHSAMDISRDLLSTYLTLSTLATVNLSSLEDHFGLSSSTALKLLATFEYHNRLNSPLYQHQYSVATSQDIYQRYRYLESYSQEVLAIVMLSKNRKIIKEKILYKGTQENINVSIREIYMEIVMSKCKEYVLIHNHPNGNVKPTRDDEIVTKNLEKACNAIQISMFDHIIIYPGGYCSFNDYYQFANQKPLVKEA